MSAKPSRTILETICLMLEIDVHQYIPWARDAKVVVPLERVVGGRDWSFPQIHSHNTKGSRTREEGERAYLVDFQFS